MKKRKPPTPKITEAVSIVAHQLKGPLSVIKGYLEALLIGDCGSINSLQKEYLEDALKNIERMKKNIESLLLVHRIEEGKYQPVLKPIALDKMTLKILADFTPWAKALNCIRF